MFVSVYIIELNSKQSRRHSADGNALDSGSKRRWFDPPTMTKLAQQNLYSNTCTLSNGLLESAFGPNWSDLDYDDLDIKLLEQQNALNGLPLRPKQGQVKFYMN